MFNILPEKIAVKALHEVLKISMDTLTVRYCQLEPATKRLTQYRDACNARTYKKYEPLSIEQHKSSRRRQLSYIKSISVSKGQKMAPSDTSMVHSRSRLKIYGCHLL